MTSYDWLKEDPPRSSQKLVLLSMVEPRNSNKARNRESFIAANFIKYFLDENKQVKEYIKKKGTGSATDLMKEKLCYDYENIRKLYYSFTYVNGKKLEEEFTEKYNKNDEVMVTGIKVRGVYAAKGPELDSDIKTFRSLEPNIDIYTAPVGKWVPYIPSGQRGVTEEFANDKLTEIFKDNQKEIDATKKEFDERCKIHKKEQKEQKYPQE